MRKEVIKFVPLVDWLYLHISQEINSKMLWFLWINQDYPLKYYSMDPVVAGRWTKVMLQDLDCCSLELQHLVLNGGMPSDV